MPAPMAATSILLQSLNDPGVRSTIIFVFIVQVILAIFLGMWISRDAKRRGLRSTAWTFWLVGAFLLSLILGLLVTLLYLSVRAPATPDLPPLGAMPHPSGGESGGWATPPSLPVQPARPPAPTGYAVAPTSASSKVRCPRCQNVFEFIRQAHGATQVKCPSCGMEGTI